MKQARLFILLLCCNMFCYSGLYAQYNIKQNNVFAISGQYAGLDFNNDTVVAIQNNLNGDANEVTGPASVCDTGGHLLFYTSGDSIWDKNNQLMPNGGGLIYPYSSASTTQGSLIVPVLSNPNQYYVFSLQEITFGDPFAGRLYYCIVDMTLNGGLGDVVAGQRMIPLDSVLSEKMIAIQGNNCNIWLLLHDNVNNNFKAYEITSAGINTTPVISGIGNIVGFSGLDAGTMKISPDRSKLAMCTATLLGPGGAELFDFDPATGTLSNAIELDTVDRGCYGVAFSPDNSKLYCTALSSSFETYLSQYDISLTDATAIVNSRVILDSGDYGTRTLFSDLRLCTDNKIYMPSGMNGGLALDSITQIDFPNLAGTACGYTFNAFPLVSGTSASNTDGGMGNIYVQPIQDTISGTIDTFLSLAGNLTLQIPPGYFNYYWSDGTTDSGKIIQDTGTYWVIYSNYCTYRTDTFVVRPATGITNVTGNSAATLFVYPSPAQTTVNVTLTGMNNVNGTLQVIDAVGRTVLNEPCNSKEQTLNISNIAAGVYTIQYTDKFLSVRLQQQVVVSK